MAKLKNLLYYIPGLATALVIAAAAAEGESRIGKLFHIDRGYEKIEDSLSALGVDIKRI